MSRTAEHERTPPEAARFKMAVRALRVFLALPFEFSA